MKKLLLIGGGHAQLSVLHALAGKSAGLEVVLVTPTHYQIYSGMLPDGRALQPRQVSY